MLHSIDHEIRTAFHEKRLRRQHACANTFVIDELGVAHGKKRIDIAVLNGCIHGYEIKSSKDNLSRLGAQLFEYSRCLEKLSIISAPNHVANSLRIAPAWCGIIVAEKGRRGGIGFRTLRRARKNPNVDLEALSHFLWRQEVVELLSALGADQSIIKGNRIELYRQLAKNISLRDLSVYIKSKFMERENWRVGEQPLSNGGSFLPASR